MTASAAVVAVVRRIIEGPRLATREELAEECALLRDERVGCEVRAATTACGASDRDAACDAPIGDADR